MQKNGVETYSTNPTRLFIIRLPTPTIVIPRIRRQLLVKVPLNWSPCVKTEEFLCWKVHTNFSRFCKFLRFFSWPPSQVATKNRSLSSENGERGGHDFILVICRKLRKLPIDGHPTRACPSKYYMRRVGEWDLSWEMKRLSKASFSLSFGCCSH